jgi:GBP family porin
MTSRMKSSLALAVAALSLAPAVTAAQATFQIAAIGDVAVSSQTNRARSDGTPGTMTTVSSGAWQSTRVAIRGKVPVNEELTGFFDAATTLGLNAGTILNTGSVSSSGSLNAFRLFDRNAFAGVSSAQFGSLTAGRQATALAEALWVTDPLKANAGATNPNVRLGYLAGPGKTIQSSFGPNPAQNVNGNALDRQDNMVKYGYKHPAGFVGLASYSFGGVAGDGGASNSAGALLGWDHSSFSVRAAGAQFSDPKSTPLLAWTGGATAKLGPVQLKGTYSENRIDDTPTYGKLRTDLWSAGVTWSVTSALDVTAAYYDVRRTQVGALTQEAQKLYLVPEWNLSKTLMLYGIVDYEMFNDAGAALDTGTPLPAGTKSSVYLAVGVSFSFGT